MKTTIVSFTKEPKFAISFYYKPLNEVQIHLTNNRPSHIGYTHLLSIKELQEDGRTWVDIYKNPHQNDEG